MKTFVYVISGEHGRQKIGSSDDPAQRIRSLQTGSPYPLKFEFIGEVENGAGGQVEVEAHFTLHEHKSPGGDEWFVVPSDVAITAVMAAAHRLGYRIKPVDADAIIPRSYAAASKRPWWLIALMLPVYGWFAYWIFGISDPRLQSGDMLLGTFAIEAIVLIGCIFLLQAIVRVIGYQIIGAFRAASNFMEPSSPDRT